MTSVFIREYHGLQIVRVIHMSQIVRQRTKKPCQHILVISNKVLTNVNEMFDLQENSHRSSTFKNTCQIDLPKSQGLLLNNLADTMCPFISYQVVPRRDFGFVMEMPLA